jgi:hypothetical protein
MTAYHSKRGPVEGCPQPDEPIRERAWTDGQKDDMHREAFERWCERRGIATSPEHRTYEYQQAYEDWQAAMRYHDEQEKQA